MGSGIDQDQVLATITGGLEYQGCDDKLCYTPQAVPARWVLPLQALDRRPRGKRKKKGSAMRGQAVRDAGTGRAQGQAVRRTDRLVPGAPTNRLHGGNADRNPRSAGQ